VRDTARAALEWAVHAASLARLGRRTNRQRPLILAYHNIIPDDSPASGERSLHLPLSAFEAQLDHLQAHAEVVPLSAVTEPWKPGGRLRVALTFDDAYRGAVVLGLPELARRGLPATVFVVPGCLGSRAFWWDQLAGPAGELSPAVRQHALTDCRGSNDEVLAWASQARLPVADVPSMLRTATEPELVASLRLGSFTAGCHTWSHPNLTMLDEAAQSVELTRAVEWLERNCRDQAIRWLAYPYGEHTGAVEAAAARAGLRHALAVAGGFVAPHATAFTLPRLTIPARLSRRGFELRVAGLISR